MKKIDENNVILRKNTRKTPFEIAQLAAKKRALLAKIYEETREVVASYDRLPELSKASGMPLEALEALADEALVALATAMETEFGVSA